MKPKLIPKQVTETSSTDASGQLKKDPTSILWRRGTVDLNVKNSTDESPLQQFTRKMSAQAIVIEDWRLKYQAREEAQNKHQQFAWLGYFQ